MARPSNLAFSLIAILGALVVAIFVYAGQSVGAHQARLDVNRDLVTRLGLTDLALFTEARYTRHPSQADSHAALQDHPGAFDHFPTGSLMPPPDLLTESHANLAGKTKTPD